MEGSNAGFVQSVDGPAPGPFLYLGAKHMVTGYDHLLFLVGVIFFLYRLKDVVVYVSLFTLGHSLTLLFGVLGGVSVNAYVIDAIIGLSVVYKGFENINGFERVFKVKPNTKVAVLVYRAVSRARAGDQTAGLHGLGERSCGQHPELQRRGRSWPDPGADGSRGAPDLWRTRSSFLSYAFAANAALMVGGFLLAGIQMVGSCCSPDR